MTRTSIFATGTTFVLSILLATGASAQVEEEGTPPADTQPAAQQQEAEDRPPAAEQRERRQRTRASADRHEIPAARAANLSGMTVRNADGVNLGTIHDIHVNLNEGRVAYAALTRGGLAGIGASYYAIPWELFEYKRVDAGDYLLLRVSEDVFKGLEGFDTNNWPDRADRRWFDRVEQVEGQSPPRRGGGRPRQPAADE